MSPLVHACAARARRGGALILALVVVASVTGIALGLLRITHATTARQSHSVDDKRAFYLAEAGLSQAYFGLGAGMSGQIGSIEKPALVGDGLAWVDASEREDGLLVLRSTGLCAAGRSTLEIVVERVEEAPGVFADEEIDLDVPFLVDGYDPQKPYYDQVQDGAITIDPGYPFLYVDTTNKILFYREVFYRFYEVVGNDYYYDAVLDYRAHELPGVDWDDFIDLDDYDLDDYDDLDLEQIAVLGDLELSALLKKLGPHPDFKDEEYKEVLKYFASIPKSTPTTLVVPTSLGPTTGANGAMGSNGPISLSSSGGTTTIYGDAIPGKGSGLSKGLGVVVTGKKDPRSQPVELAAVRPPEVELLPAIMHSSSIPKVVPPGTLGYEGIHVATGSELVIQGPGSLVVGELALDPLSLLLVDNAAGAVDLFVTESAHLEESARLQVEAQDTSQLSLQGAPTATELDLHATSQFHGTVYAPDSHVTVGSDFEVFGALVANTLALEPGVRLHRNTGKDLGSAPLPKVMGWRIDEVPAEVRQSRQDPMELLQLDAEDLKPITAAGVKSSWTYEVTYTDHAGQKITYKGPFENFDITQVKYYWFYPSPVLTPPDAEYTSEHGEWEIFAQYKTVFGTVKEFTGTIRDYAKWTLFQAVVVLERELYPPN